MDVFKIIYDLLKEKLKSQKEDYDKATEIIINILNDKQNYPDINNKIIMENRGFSEKMKDIIKNDIRYSISRDNIKYIIDEILELKF